jgi:hypothetical protein
MDENKLVENPKLISYLQSENGNIDGLMELLKQSNLLVIGNLKNNELTFEFVSDKEGDVFLQVFTDWSQIHEVKDAIVLPYQKIVEILRSNPKIGGVSLNRYTHNMLLPKTLFGVENRVAIGVPANVPEKLKARLITDYSDYEPRLVQIIRNGKRSYMVAFNTRTLNFLDGEEPLVSEDGLSVDTVDTVSDMGSYIIQNYPKLD